MECVDDRKSSHYDHIVDRRTVTGDRSSAEDMRRSDDLYTTTRATPPARAAALLPRVGRRRCTTVGCTAMATDKLADLLATHDPTAVFVLLPKAEYAALAAAWGLP